MMDEGVNSDSHDVQDLGMIFSRWAFGFSQRVKGTQILMMAMISMWCIIVDSEEIIKMIEILKTPVGVKQ